MVILNYLTTLYTFLHLSTPNFLKSVTAESLMWQGFQGLMLYWLHFLHFFEDTYTYIRIYRYIYAKIPRVHIIYIF